MKTSSRKLLSLLVPSSLVFTLVLATFSLKAEPPSPHLTEATTAMRGCDELKTLRQKLQIDFRLQAATMKQEITKLNDAPADQQVALLVQTLTHLTEQQTALAARQIDVEDELLEHTLQHVHMGAESVASCPLFRKPVIPATEGIPTLK